MSSLDKAYADFIARYHGDHDFAKQADSDPAAALRKCGVDVPQGKNIKLVKNTDSMWHYVVPSSPVADLSQGELAGTAAGNCGQQCSGSNCHCNTE